MGRALTRTRTIGKLTLVALLGAAAPVAASAAAAADEDARVVLVAEPAPTLAAPGKLKAIVLGPPTLTAAAVELRTGLEIAGPAKVHVALGGGGAATQLAVPRPAFSTNGAVHFERVVVDPRHRAAALGRAP